MPGKAPSSRTNQEVRGWPQSSDCAGDQNVRGSRSFQTAGRLVLSNTVPVLNHTSPLIGAVVSLFQTFAIGRLADGWILWTIPTEKLGVFSPFPPVFPPGLTLHKLRFLPKTKLHPISFQIGEPEIRENDIFAETLWKNT